VTRYEKITTVLSIIAIAFAMANPFLFYLWLNPSLQEFKHRARLQVSSSKDSSQFNTQVERKIILDGNDETESVPISFDLQILNVGEMPAKDVQIVAQYYTAAPEKPLIIFDPPTQYEVVNRSNQIFVTVKRPIAAQDRLKVSFKDYPSQVSVSNEFGETSTIDTELGWFHRSGELKKEIQKYTESQKPNKRP
jgi:hypothetical protein